MPPIQCRPHCLTDLECYFSLFWFQFFLQRKNYFCKEKNHYCKEKISFSKEKASHQFNAGRIVWQTWNAIFLSFDFNSFCKEKNYFCKEKNHYCKEKISFSKEKARHEFNAGRIVWQTWNAISSSFCKDTKFSDNESKILLDMFATILLEIFALWYYEYKLYIPWRCSDSQVITTNWNLFKTSQVQKLWWKKGECFDEMRFLTVQIHCLFLVSWSRMLFVLDFNIVAVQEIIYFWLI